MTAVTKGLIVRLEAGPGREDELAAFLDRELASGERVADQLVRESRGYAARA